MTGQIVPDEGLEWFGDKAIDNVTDVIDTVKVGTGTTDPAPGDTSLENVEFSATTADVEVSVEEIDPNEGLVRATMEIIGDNQIADGVKISEFGVFTTSGTMIFREVRNPITVQSNIQIIFEIDVDIQR